MNTKLIFLLIAILIMGGCTPKECRNVTDVTFELLVEYSPIQDTFNIGDTLHIFSEFSDLIRDVKSGEFLKVKDFSFFSVIDIAVVQNGERIMTDIEEDQIVNMDVDYELVHFTSSPGTGIIIDNHTYKNGVYSFELGLILLKEGLFSISCISDLGLSIGTSSQKFDGQCPNQEVYAQYKLNHEDAYEYNFDLIEGQIPYEHVSEELFIRGAGYVFYVIE